jgi:trehalose synthase
MEPGKMNESTTAKEKSTSAHVADSIATRLAAGEMTASFIEKRKKPRTRQKLPTPARVPTLGDYEPLVSKAEVDEIRFLAEGLHRKSVKIVSAPDLESNAAEMLNRLVPLLGELEVAAQWDRLAQTEESRNVAKQLKRSLASNDSWVTKELQEFCSHGQDDNLGRLRFDEDVVVLQDLETLGLIRAKETRDQRWVWRCHLDLSSPSAETWKILKPFVEAHDAAIFSTQSFACRGSIPAYLFYPCIDPLSERNKQLEPSVIQQVCEEFGIDRSRAIVTQVSPFDRARDPLGVIDAYRIAKKYVDCQLVLAGSTSEDDPDSSAVLSPIKEAAAGDSDIILAIVQPDSGTKVNAIQSASTIIVQKSVYEGFGTTVTEALWKGKPVIGSAVGGIPNQIIHKFTGALVHSVEGCAYQIRYLLTHPGLAEQLGKNGREHVKENFLVTSEVKRWLLLFHILLRVAQN